MDKPKRWLRPEFITLVHKVGTIEGANAFLQELADAHRDMVRLPFETVSMTTQMVTEGTTAVDVLRPGDSFSIQWMDEDASVNLIPLPEGGYLAIVVCDIEIYPATSEME